jgi:hypothetical protein
LINAPFGWVEYTKRKIGCQEKYFICGYSIYGNNESSFSRLAERVSSGLFSFARMFAVPGKGERGKEDGGKGDVQAEFAVKHSRLGAFSAHPERDI